MESTVFSDQSFDQKRALWPFLKRIIGYAWKYPHWVLGLLFWVAIVAIADALFPLLLKFMLDDAVAPELLQLKNAQEQGLSYTIDLSAIYYYSGLFVVVGIVQVIGIYLIIRYAGRIQEYVMHDLRKAMFERLQKLSFSFYDRSASGWLLTRLTSDTDRVAEVISWGLLEAFWGSSMIIFCLLVLFLYSWKLGLVVLLSIPLMLIVSVKIRLLVLQYSRDARKINSELTATFTEHINGIVVNKSTAQEVRVGEQFKGLSGRMQRASFRSAYYTAMYIPVVILIGSIATALVIYWGGNMALGIPAVISVGTLVAALDYTTKIFIPIVDISMFYARAQGSLSAGERIFSLIDEPLQIKDAPNATDFEILEGAIEFKEVGFHYVAEHPVLQQFNLKIEAGTSLALVGATGEGKTTIANLVARFYEPTAGHLLIDGIDYTTKRLHSLRRQMGTVLQNPHLFEGSIRDNIRYAKQEATDEEILAVLELLGATTFMDRLEEPVGEEGEHLSMGEKQLLSFARAILLEPKILIMDEATSSIDTLTEAAIQKSIDKMLQGRTAIIIAHRLSTIRNCDRILVIKKGQIVEDGSHDVLMQQKGKYYNLYTKQLRAEVGQS